MRRHPLAATFLRTAPRSPAKRKVPSLKARFITMSFVLVAALALGGAVHATPAAATINLEDSYLVCPEIHGLAALYFPRDSQPRYTVYAIRIDGGAWRYGWMYFAHGREWQWLNGGWVSTYNVTWGQIWAPNDGRNHFVEVYEARSNDNKTYSSWIRVAAPCETTSLYAPYAFSYDPNALTSFMTFY